ncbi:hypothetical protein MKD33_17540, partial [Chromobacterium piscinae]
AALEAWLAATP